MLTEWARIWKSYGPMLLNGKLKCRISPRADDIMALDILLDDSEKRFLEFRFIDDGLHVLPGFLDAEHCCQGHLFVQIPTLHRTCRECHRPLPFAAEEATAFSTLLGCLSNTWASFLSHHDQDRPQGPFPLLYEDHLCVFNASHYQALREALSCNTFKHVEESPWPTANLEKRSSKGHAQLIPLAMDSQPLIPFEERNDWIEQMWRQREELSDLDADALDAISAIWLSQARTPNDDACADVDQILAMRGLKPKRNSSNRRGGYMPRQRLDILRALSHIQSLWLTMTELETYVNDGKKNRRVTQTLQSRAFVITDRIGQLYLDGLSMDVQKFIFKPGKVFGHFLFGPGRQTALLSANALRYDPYRQKWEKRLIRYLSWRWRSQARSGRYLQPLRVETLLELVGEDCSAWKPNRIKERLEKALDTLQHSGDITEWLYDKERWDEAIVGRKGWLPTWKNALLLIEPPKVVPSTYRPIENPVKPAAPRALPPLRLGTRLEETRKRRGLSQRSAARELGISQPFLSKIERDLVPSISPDLEKRLQEWAALEPSD